MDRGRTSKGRKLLPCSGEKQENRGKKARHMCATPGQLVSLKMGGRLASSPWSSTEGKMQNGQLATFKTKGRAGKTHTGVPG